MQMKAGTDTEVIATRDREDSDKSYGRFSDDGREYIIERIDIPRAWINYLSNEKYCAMLSHTGGGYSFYESSGYDRIIREYAGETLYLDKPGRTMFVRDRDSGNYWSLNGHPNNEKPDSWCCRHGLGYSIIESEMQGLKSSITYFVPVDDPCEVWLVRLENTGTAPRALSVFPMVEWCLGNYAFDMMERAFANLFNENSYEDNVIYATKRFWNLPVARRRAGDRMSSSNTNLAWDKWAYMASSFEPSGFDVLKENFYGQYRGWTNPVAIERGSCTSQLADGREAVGVLQGDFDLEPGEAVEFTISIGVAYDKKESKVIIEKYRSLSRAKAEHERLKGSWDKYLKHVNVETPDNSFDLSVNIWNKYQAWVIARWSRMDSYYIGGGSILGFRDTCQDIISMLPIDINWSKERTILVAEHQMQDGSCLHNWDPRTNLCTKTGHSDDPLWLIMAIINYIKESGELTFLDELVRFYDAGPRSIFTHLMRAIDYCISMTSHEITGLGISLMGAADWNDGLDQIGNEGIGESIMTTEFLCWMLQEVADICERRNEPKQAKKYLNQYKKFKDRLNLLAWDGHWYIRATNDNRDIIGSSQNSEGSMYLNPQSWAIMSGVAEGERAITCMDSVKSHLDTKYGPLLLEPAYEKPNANVGIITRFAPGTKENATVFNHTVAWTIIAECILGRGDMAFEYWRKTSFVERGKDPELYKAEPYVYAEFVYGPASPYFGEGSFTWTTGTAAWMWRACLDWICGVRPHVDGLMVDPCVPGWKEFKVHREFRGGGYDFEFKNPEGVYQGIKSITANGQAIDGNIIPPLGKGEHLIEVIMG